MSWRDILQGASGILDFAGYLRSDRYFTDDWAAIAGDWQAVNDDLRIAMEGITSGDPEAHPDDLLDQEPRLAGDPPV